MTTTKQKKTEAFQKKVFYIFASFVTATLALFGFFTFAGGQNKIDQTMTSLASLFLFLGLVGAFAFLGFALYVKASNERYKKEHQDDYIFRN